MAILPLYAGGGRADMDGRGRHSLAKRLRRRLLELRLAVSESPHGALALVSLVLCGVLFVAVGVMLRQPEDAVLSPAQQLCRERRDRVRQAFIHAWSGYEQHAFGHDEVRPTTNATNDSWGGFGAVLVDALDTMMLMGLDAELARARAHVAKLDFRKDYSASFFETTIRYLGGLLSAYELSGDELYLVKAKQLGFALLPAFNSPSGLPYHAVNLATGEAKNPSWAGRSTILAEAGSFQLEFSALALASGQSVFADRVRSVNAFFSRAESTDGLFPVTIDIDTGRLAGSHLTTGALADSFYEYLLKQYRHTGDAESLRLYNAAARGIARLLVREVPVRNLTFIGQLDGGVHVATQDHLMCYVPGMLALGSVTLGVEKPTEQLALAERLARTCYILYRDQVTGLGPELVDFRPDAREPSAAYAVKSGAYLLRPETLESLFVLYRVTGDAKYQDWAWQIFLAIERFCRTPSAYSGLKDVTRVDGEQNNSMQSFFFAETLKYLFLIFSPDDVLPLSDWVLTTEAHPLRVRGRIAS